MRDIKFRAWNKKEKIMSEAFDIRSIIGSDVLFKPKGRAVEKNLSNLVWLQYIDLNDKKGVEIYEGDILRCYGGSDNEIVGDIYWYMAGFNVRTVDTFWSPAENDWEIIGNLYENPELVRGGN